MVRILIFGFLLNIWLAACSYHPVFPTLLPLSADSQLIRQFLVGRTIISATGTSEYHHPDGWSAYKAGKGRPVYASRWWFHGSDQMCYAYPAFGNSPNCWSFTTGPRTQTFFRDIPTGFMGLPKAPAPETDPQIYQASENLVLPLTIWQGDENELVSRMNDEQLRIAKELGYFPQHPVLEVPENWR